MSGPLFEVGDRVIIEDADFLRTQYTVHPCIDPGMLKYSGKEAEIIKVERSTKGNGWVYKIKGLEDWNDLLPIWFWHETWLIGINDSEMQTEVFQAFDELL